MRSRAMVIMMLSIVLGLTAAWGAMRWLPGLAARDAAKLAVASRDLPVGTRLGPEHLMLSPAPGLERPAGSYSDLKLLEGRVVNTTLARGSPLLESKLAPPGSKGGLSAVIADGKRAMTVKVNEVIGVAGFALPGNLVDIVLNTQEPKASPISKIVLEQILVLAVAQEVHRDETKPKVVSAVTLEVTPAQAEKLDLGRSVGTLSLVLRNQVDRRTVATSGMRRSELLGMPELRPAVAPVQRSKSASAAKHGEADEEHSAAQKVRTVEVIRGVSRKSVAWSEEE